MPSLSTRHRDISDSRVKWLRAGCRYERSPCVRVSDALTLNTCQPVCYLGSERGGLRGNVDFEAVFKPVHRHLDVKESKQFILLSLSIHLLAAESFLALLCSLRCNKCPLYEGDSFVARLTLSLIF